MFEPSMRLLAGSPMASCAANPECSFGAGATLAPAEKQPALKALIGLDVGTAKTIEMRRNL